MGLRDFFKSYDLFPAVPCFRVKGDSEVLSVCGGVFSLLLLIFFLYVFIQRSLIILNHNDIEYKASSAITQTGTARVDDFVFAIGLRGIPF